MKLTGLFILLTISIFPFGNVLSESSPELSDFFNNFKSHAISPVKSVPGKVIRKDAQVHILSTIATKAAQINAPVSSNTFNVDIALSSVSQYVSTTTQDYNLEKKFVVKVTKSGNKKVNTYSETSRIRGGKQIENYIQAGRDTFEVSVPESVLAKLSDFEVNTLSRFVGTKAVKVSKSVDNQIVTTKFTDPERVRFLMKTFLEVLYVKNDFGIEQYEYTDVVSVKTGKPKPEFSPSRHIQVGVSSSKLREAILKIYRSDLRPKNMTNLDYVRLINFFDSTSLSGLVENLTIDFWIDPVSFEIYKIEMPSTSISFQDELISINASLDFGMQDKKINQNTVIKMPKSYIEYSLLKKRIDALIKKKKMNVSPSGTVK